MTYNSESKSNFFSKGWQNTIILTKVPSDEELNDTSSIKAFIRGIPSPRSKFQRSGSVTGGCLGNASISKPFPKSLIETSK